MQNIQTSKSETGEDIISYDEVKTQAFTRSSLEFQKLQFQTKINELNASIAKIDMLLSNIK